MVYEVPSEKYEKYRCLFDKDSFSANETFVDSAFQYKSAKLFVDDENKPLMAILRYPFVSFIVGDPETPKLKEMFDMVPEHKLPESPMYIRASKEKWLKKLEEYFGDKLRKKTRIKMSHKNLSLKKLEKLKKPLPEGFKLEQVDKETVEKIPHIFLSIILMLYGTIDNFIKNGIGFCVKHGDNPISIACSFIPYTDLLEVQIATADSPNYRRKGFGTAACIALIEYCIKNNIEPYWDAIDERSASMAQKLGYTNPESYDVYMWKNQ